MLRTAAPKKTYKIPINPPKKYKKVKTQKKCSDGDEVMNGDNHTKNPKKPKNTSDIEEKSKYSHPNNSESSTNLNIFAANADGLQGKQVSLKHEIDEAKASIFCIQETKFRKSGRLSMDNFVIFEAIRKNKEKGGTMIGINENLKPVLIEEYSDTFELIVVEIKVEDKEIRVITGYGPQENWETSEKMPFFVALEKEISKAIMNGKLVIIELDANSKLGSTYVENDPHEMSANGRILEGIIQRNGLIVANGVKGKSHGTITRKRTTAHSVEQSVIDYVLISEELESHMTGCYIDDKRKNVLTRISKTKQGIKRVESDHNTIITKFDLKVKDREKVKKTEIFNFKDKDSLKRFKEITSNNSELSSIFDSKRSVEKQAKQFMKRLNGMLHQCFKKIKIKENSIKEEDILYKMQKDLKSENNVESKEKLRKVEEKLVKLKSNDLHKIVKEEIEKIDCEAGGFNSGHLWKIKSKLQPKMSNKYTAIEDENGKLLTSEEDIDNETVKHYTKVLENRKIYRILRNIKKIGKSSVREE